MDKFSYWKIIEQFTIGVKNLEKTEKTLSKYFKEKEIIYYLNGTIKFQRQYKDGKRHGKCKEFYENGKIQSEFYYNNGNLFETVRYYKIAKEPRICVIKQYNRNSSFSDRKTRYFRNGQMKEW